MLKGLGVLKFGIEKIDKTISKRIVFDKNIGIENTVFLASMGRSGSTFLSNIINADNSFRVLFEPFRYDVVDEAQNFVYPFYLRADDNQQPIYYSSAQKIILGQVHSEWIDRENKTIFPKARLIKDIRANFFLKWIHHNFSGIKIILLLRHPCAVVSSWISAGFGDGRKARERLLENPDFVADIDDLLLKEYMKAETDFERLIFLWCFSYYVPFQQFNYNNIHIVFYENIILDPSNEAKRLFKAIGCDYSEAKVLDSLSKPSSTTSKSKSLFDRKVIRINKWQDNCSKNQSDRAFEIMNLFGMDALYCPVSSTPSMEVARSLFRSSVTK